MVVSQADAVLHAQYPDVVQLTLGSHQLEGKVVSLKKPLAILDFAAGKEAMDTGEDRQHCEVSRCVCCPKSICVL